MASPSHSRAQADNASKRYVVDKSRVARILCHRRDPSNTANRYVIRPTQYLVRWSENKSDPALTPLSWHSVDELASVLELLQQYVQTTKIAQSERRADRLSTSIIGRKRKYLHDSSYSLPTPQSRSSETSREQSIISSSDTESKQSFTPDTPLVYNGVFRRRQGVLAAVPATNTSENEVEAIDATLMPMKYMVDESMTIDMIDAEMAIRQRYHSILQRLPGPTITLRNDLDHETPSLEFKFISEYILRDGVERLDQELMVGCDKCKPNMGANRGCEYTKKCGCLEYAEPDESAMTEDQLAEWQIQKHSSAPQTEDLPKKFPYFSTGPRSGCLVDHYLTHRYMIYECNKLCSCGRFCKNRNVQHGRKVKLEIFKTHNRGFGLRCPEPLRKGQFIDTYLGEIVTDAEASRREEVTGPSKASYLFSLDKFATRPDGSEEIQREDMYVVDGQSMGCPTRFINHCCEPNLRMYTVSYSKYDRKIYDLAFFAIDAIAAGTELTFDYMDIDESEEYKQAKADDPDVLKVPCRCGAERCRGFLW